MDNDEFETRSRELGLSKLATNHKADLRKALENGAALSSKVPPGLHWTDEPSHTFSLSQHRKVRA